MGSAFSFTASSWTARGESYMVPKKLINVGDEKMPEAVDFSELPQHGDDDVKSNEVDYSLLEGPRSKRPPIYNNVRGSKTESLPHLVQPFFEACRSGKISRG